MFCSHLLLKTFAPKHMGTIESPASGASGGFMTDPRHSSLTVRCSSMATNSLCGTSVDLLKIVTRFADEA